MNTRWLKQNVGMVLLGLVFLAGLGAALWQLNGAMARKASVEASLAQRQQDLQANLGKRPFPSEQNIQKLRTDIQQVQELSNQLQQRLAEKNLPQPPARSEIDLREFLSRTLEKLSNSAENKMLLPEKYSFGFSRYLTVLPCRDPAVKKEECLALLGKQVVIIEQLTNLLITNGVYRLDHIRRAEVEAGTSGDSLTAPMGNHALFTTMPFELKFSCGPDALKGFINGLSQMDWLVAIRNLDLQVTGSEATSPAAGPGDRRIAATLRLDVIEFPQFRARAPKSTVAGR